MNEKSLIKEAKEIIEILHKTSLIMQEENPLEAYKKSKEIEASQLQNKIDILAQRNAHIRFSSQHTKEEERLQRIFHIFLVINFHKLLTTEKQQKFNSFHFLANSFPSLLKKEMDLDEICLIMLHKYKELDTITFNTLLLIITETENSLIHFYNLFSIFYNENREDAINFLIKWMQTTPEIFVDPLQLERKLFPTNLPDFNQKKIFNIAKEFLLQPFCNKPIQVYDKFDLDMGNIDNLIHDFDQNIKEVFGPYSSDIKGFSAKDVANCFFVIFSLVINQRTLDRFVRKRMDERQQFLTIIHSSIHDSIMLEFQNTLEKYLNDPKTTDNQLELIIKRFHSIIDACNDLNCYLLSKSFSEPPKTISALILKRFKEHNFNEGIKEWNSLPKTQCDDEIRYSASFREKMIKSNPELTKHELPLFISFSTECIHAKSVIEHKKDGKINITPFFNAALIYDVINGSQRCVDSEPISMSLLYSVLSFMFKNIKDPKLMKIIDNEQI